MLFVLVKFKVTIIIFFISYLLLQTSGCIGSEDPKATLEIDILVLESGILNNDSPEPLSDVEVILEIHYTADHMKDKFEKIHEKRLRTDNDGRIVYRYDVTYIGLFEARCLCLSKYHSNQENVEHLGVTYKFEINFD